MKRTHGRRKAAAIAAPAAALALTLAAGPAQASTEEEMVGCPGPTG